MTLPPPLSAALPCEAPNALVTAESDRAQHGDVASAIYLEIERQQSIGAGTVSIDPETGLMQVSMDVDAGSLARATIAALSLAVGREEEIVERCAQAVIDCAGALIWADKSLTVIEAVAAIRAQNRSIPHVD